MSKPNNKEIKEKMRKQLSDEIYITELTKKSFEVADKNHNGIISINELKNSMIDIAKGLGYSLPNNQNIQAEFDKLDLDKNKKIDFLEFKEFVKKNMLILIDRIPE